MLSNLLLIFRFNIRKIKTSSSINNSSKFQGAKFSEDQLTSMASSGVQPRVKSREAFKMKYQKGEEESSTKYEKKVKKNKQKEFANKPLFKHEEKGERISVENIEPKDLASVRLGPQYLPQSYLRKVQKVFHKYDQHHLREIANNFSELVRLRYTEEKLNYDEYKDLKFERLEQKLPKERQVQQIYLIGENKIYENQERTSTRKVDEEPFKPEISYTQNIAVSYLLNRVPRTFATAIRMMTQIKYKYPTFKPQSFLDFGSGLSSGSCAFIDIFEETGEVYNVEPAGKMRKLSKYLTSDFNIRHFETLGELSQKVKQVDVVYAGYVINQLKPELVQVYLEALYAKVKAQGFLVIAEYGSPFGARIIHSARKWAIEKNMKIAAPCPHHGKCPLSRSNSWCHFDQPSGMYPSQIFGKLPTDQAVQLEKFSYLILQKKEEENTPLLTEKIEANITEDWDRVIFPVMKRGKHIVLNLCTKQGTYERRVYAKSHGSEYKQVKKLKWGDYWRFGKRIPNKYRKERRIGKRLW